MEVEGEKNKLEQINLTNAKVRINGSDNELKDVTIKNDKSNTVSGGIGGVSGIYAYFKSKLFWQTDYCWYKINVYIIHVTSVHNNVQVFSSIVTVLLLGRCASNLSTAVLYSRNISFGELNVIAEGLKIL